MFTDKVKEYLIDLKRSERQRWDDVIQSERRSARAVAREAMDDMATACWVTESPTARLLFGGLYRLFGGQYYKEMAAWADALGVAASTSCFLNCTYEVSHIGGGLASPFGCTAGIRWVHGVGNVHVRSMDWPLESIGRGTRRFRFKDGSRQFVSVGVVGHVSVISGMVPGAYSVTINWAPPVGVPRFTGWGPSFLLRNVLETCDTFDDAVEALSDCDLATSVFFTVCGIKKDEACIIERTKNDCAIRWSRKGSIAQANHHVLPDFEDNNDALKEESVYLDSDDPEDPTVYDDSYERAQTLHRKLQKAKSVQQCIDALDYEPVLNEQSFQQMMFVPKTGAVKVWRWLSH